MTELLGAQMDLTDTRGVDLKSALFGDVFGSNRCKEV